MKVRMQTWAQGEKSENMPKKATLWRAYVSLDKKPLSRAESALDRMDLFETNGQYQLTYKITNKSMGLGKALFFRYKINGDVFRRYGFVGCAYKNWSDFKKRTSMHPDTKLCVEYSGVSPETFRLAKRNPGVAIPFCFDFVRYCKDVGGDTLLFNEEKVREKVDADRARVGRRAKQERQNIVKRLSGGRDPLDGKKIG